jgi:hypothetical protein
MPRCGSTSPVANKADDGLLHPKNTLDCTPRRLLLLLQVFMAVKEGAVMGADRGAVAAPRNSRLGPRQSERRLERACADGNADDIGATAAAGDGIRLSEVRTRDLLHGGLGTGSAWEL